MLNHNAMQVVVMVSEKSNINYTVNETINLLSKLCSGKAVSYSKSYTAGFFAVAAGSIPVAVDIESISRFREHDTLVRKLSFFTSNAIIERIMRADDSSYQAAKLWTRKECIYKMFNERNAFSHEEIYNEDENITLGTMRIVSMRVTNQIILSYMCSKECINSKVYLNVNGDQYEKNRI